MAVTDKYQTVDILDLSIQEVADKAKTEKPEHWTRSVSTVLSRAYAANCRTFGTLLALDEKELLAIEGVTPKGIICFNEWVETCFTKGVVNSAKTRRFNIVDPHSQRGHNRRSPSHAATWGNCPGSAREEAKYPDTTSSAAEYGTAGHMLAEECLLEGGPEKLGNAFARVGQTRNGVEVTKEMAQQVNDFVTLCHDIQRECGGHLYTEVPVPLIYDEGETGTADVAIASYLDVIHCIDLKMGYYEVMAEGNLQGQIYLLGLMKKLYGTWRASRYVFHIYQPNCMGRKHKMVEYSYKDLLKLESDIRRRYRKSLHPEAELIPGEAQCKWCKAFPCAAADKRVKELMAVPKSDQLTLPDPYEIPIEKCVEFFKHKQLVVNHMAAIEERLYDELKSGNPEVSQHLKFVEGRSSKVLEDEAKFMQTAKTLGVPEDELYTEPKLRTPAQLEGVVADQVFNKHKLDSKVGLNRNLGELAEDLGVSESLFFKPQTLISVAAFEKLIGKKAFAEHADLVEKEGRTRKWAPVEGLDQLLENILNEHNVVESVYTDPKPETPTKIKGIIKDKLLYSTDIMGKKPGAPVMALADDPRKAIANNAQDDFLDMIE